MAKSQIEGSRMRDAFLGFPALLDPEPISINDSNSEGIEKQLEKGDTVISEKNNNNFLEEVALELKQFFSNPLRK